MWTTYAPAISLLLGLVVVVTVAIVFFTRTATPAPTGDENSPSAPMMPVAQPSIERSPTSSTVSITVQANPDRPLAYTVERLNGSERLRALTVVYEESPGALESAILRSDAFASSTDDPPAEPVVDGVDDPRWLARIQEMRTKL